MSTATPPAHAARDDAMLRLLAPLARLALAQGITLQPLVELAKLALAAAAAREAPDASMSSLSVRTGVHRKDLKRIAERPVPRPTRSVSAEVFARWTTDPRWTTRRGRPRVLPRGVQGDTADTFAALVAGVTTDVHPRAVLEELQRLSLASVDARERVRLVADAYVPRADGARMLGLLADNVGDHLDAAVANLRGGGDRFLEQAMFSDGLSADSADAFNRATRRAWARVHDELMPLLQALHDADRARPASETSHRVRLGVYGYVERSPDA